MRIVALLSVRNEELYISRVIEHLFTQGIEICVIDNESTDATVEIAQKYLGRGVFRIETQPFDGYFNLVAQLSLKEQLSREIDADWFIHHDADEIREAPAPFKSLYEGILKADEEGYNAINFDEFVFLPTADADSFEGTDYVVKMRYYYFFEPAKLHRVNAWKKTGQTFDLVSSGGHSVNFTDRKIYPENFILRHYVALSRAHAIAKYGRERVYSSEEMETRGWHRARANANIEAIRFPSSGELHQMSDGQWDKSRPRRQHPIFNAMQAGPATLSSPSGKT